MANVHVKSVKDQISSKACIWKEEKSEPVIQDPVESLGEASVVKYPSGVMFWGTISTKGLILYDGPINFTEWLPNQRGDDKRKRMYMTGELYARFFREEAIPAINEVVENLDEDIFQDDQDSKHRTKMVMDVVYDLFEKRMESNDGDSKFTDVWPIENIGRMMKEKTRG